MMEKSFEQRQAAWSIRRLDRQATAAVIPGLRGIVEDQHTSALA